MEDGFFLPYQRKWILDRSRIKIMEKSRQIGMSWTAAYSLVRDHSSASCRLDSWVSSRDDAQARLFIEDCRKFAGVLDAAACEVAGSPVSDASGGAARALAFSNGTRINSLSSNPDAQAGKRGTRVLDEFALHPDPRGLYSIAYPGITWGGRLEIISTHRGRENYFNRLVEEARYGGNPKGVSLHRVTLADALDQGFLKKLKAALPEGCEVSQMDEGEYFDFVRASCADEAAFMQEYMCEPFDDASSFWALTAFCGAPMRILKTGARTPGERCILAWTWDARKTSQCSGCWRASATPSIRAMSEPSEVPRFPSRRRRFFQSFQTRASGGPP